MSSFSCRRYTSSEVRFPNKAFLIPPVGYSLKIFFDKKGILSRKRLVAVFSVHNRKEKTNRNVGEKSNFISFVFVRFHKANPLFDHLFLCNTIRKFAFCFGKKFLTTKN